MTKRSCDVTPRPKYQKSKGHPWSPCASNLVQFRLLFTKLRHFEENGTRHFSLIGRHLENVSRTIPVFKHTLAPSEKWPTQEISVRFGPFFYRVIVLTSQDAKVKGHIQLKIEENTSVNQIWCNSDHYFQSYGILKKMAHAILFRSAAILKVLVGPNWFSNLSEP